MKLLVGKLGRKGDGPGGRGRGGRGGRGGRSPPASEARSRRRPGPRGRGSLVRPSSPHSPSRFPDRLRKATDPELLTRGQRLRRLAERSRQEGRKASPASPNSTLPVWLMVRLGTGGRRGVKENGGPIAPLRCRQNSSDARQGRSRQTPNNNSPHLIPSYILLLNESTTTTYI